MRKVVNKLTLMSGSYLLDTNIIIAFYDKDPKVLEQIANPKIYVPSVVIGELLYGAEKSKKKSSNQNRIFDLVKEVTVLPVTADTSEHYAVIKNQLREQGKPIPENDIWIAAIAMEYDITLATRDKHFNNIDKIKLEAW